MFLLLVAGGAVWFTNHVVQDQEHKLLVERSREVSLVLQVSVLPVTAQLQSLRDLVTTNPGQFNQTAMADLEGAKGASFALLRSTPSGFVVESAAGPGLRVGQQFTGGQAAAIGASRVASGMIATPVTGTGANRSLGFALAAPRGMVIYRQSVVGEPHPPRQAATEPFSELRVVLYASSTPDPRQILLTNSSSAPLRGTVLYTPFLAGQSRWLLGVQPAHPLVGSATAAAPWAALVVGCGGALLVYVLMESVVRRRNAAERLYEAEHRFAETLQRRLLPTLPAPSGLDVASRYVAASDNRRVGGDWFDVFEVGPGRTGLVIGDVMGHDVEAAAAMAQVRAALRAYALDGASPAAVLERLARFTETFEVAVLVTVVYGILETGGADGARLFRWANAGHLPPMLRTVGGAVEELTEGASPVLGAPYSSDRAEASRPVPTGATLLMYTDGLVEAQGENLGHSVDALRDILVHRAGESAEDVCEAVLGVHMAELRQDDIALIAVRVLPPAPDAPEPEPSVATAR